MIAVFRGAILCVTSFLISALLAVSAAGAAQWEYSGELGPSYWGRLRSDYALCDQGRRQSPIDIVETQKQNLPPIEFRYRAAPLRLVNDGHTVRVRIANGSHILLGRERYTLQQIHFHTPGGDKVRGEEFPLAAHFLHKNSAGRLAVVVVLFRQGAENKVLTSLWSRIPSRAAGEQTLADVAINVADLLPPAHGYYAYEGSLTSPPCTEGVNWMVLKQPLELSAEQLARYRQLFANNARPVQPLHGRVVRESP